MYKLIGAKLRSCKALSQQYKELLSQCSVIILQHILDDTVEFVQYLQETGCRIEKMFGKEYSTDPTSLIKLTERGIGVEELRENGRKYKRVFEETLITGLERAKAEGRKLVIHEIGGHFSEIVLKIPVDLLPVFAGVVEDTTFGHNRYLALAEKLPVAVYSVARSVLKEIEAVFVGEATVTAFSNLLRFMGVSVPGRDVLIAGYGMIGQQVTHFLGTRGTRPTVYDIDSIKLLRAFVRGYSMVRNLERLDRYDAVFSATSSTGFQLSDIRRMKDGVILASAGSEDTEFDIRSLKRRASSIDEINKEVKVYTLSGKRVVVFRDGTAINFREKSVPNEIIDIVFSEILMAIIQLLERKHDPGMHQVLHADLGTLAGMWLDRV